MSGALPKLSKNPFAQPAVVWQVSYRVPMILALPVEESFEDGVLASSAFEDQSDERYWTVQVLLDHQPNEKLLRERIAVMAHNCGVDAPEAEIVKVENADWQRSLAQDFPPNHIGRFFIHGSHVKPDRQNNLFPVQVEAGMAFGSGEHATTSGCLTALDMLAKRREFNHVLDMGCGSAILAIAAARCWRRARILAVDIDPVSITVAKENISLNNVERQVRALVGDGYAAVEVKRAAPYDLILANILARPLVKFSPQLAANLSYGGVAVLSGLLASQESMVLAAHRRQGLRLTGRIVRNGWATLVLGR
jgi:ribosomal protein L11 methyltransferase